MEYPIPSKDISQRIADYLAENKTIITDEWLVDIGKDPRIKTDGMTKPNILNNLPKIFDSIIEAYRKDSSVATMEQVRWDTASHAIFRWQQNSHLPEVLCEISHLRAVFIHHMQILAESHPDLGTARLLLMTITIHSILDQISIDVVDQFLKLTRGDPKKLRNEGLKD